MPYIDGIPNGYIFRRQLERLELYAEQNKDNVHEVTQLMIGINDCVLSSQRGYKTSGEEKEIKNMSNDEILTLQLQRLDTLCEENPEKLLEYSRLMIAINNELKRMRGKW